jgi:hypothetical protein
MGAANLIQQYDFDQDAPGVLTLLLPPVSHTQAVGKHVWTSHHQYTKGTLHQFGSQAFNDKPNTYREPVALDQYYTPPP